MSANKIRWGVLSTAGIGVNFMIPAILKAEHSELVAISSRNIDRAKEVAARFGIPKAYGSYEEMLDDPDIDAVYNPLPNHLHVDLTLAAAQKGKHVLCEKPIGMDAKDAMRLRDVPDGILVSEAFMVRFHPQWLRAREIVRSGELGDVAAIRALFAYHNTDPGNVRNQADIGGGGILDIGCYAVTAGRFFFEAEPTRAVALVDRDPQFGTDRLASVILDFGGGRQLSFTSATQMVTSQSLELLGPKGRLEIVIPYNAPTDRRMAILVDKSETLGGELARREITEPCDQYTLEADSFSRAIRGEIDLPYDVEHAIRAMHILDAIFESEKSGGWVDVRQG